MSTSKPIEPTALVYDGCSAEQFLAFDRQVKRWLRRKFKGLTKYFWDGEAPEHTAGDANKEVVEAMEKNSTAPRGAPGVRGLFL